ncbi:MAG: 3-deoxy-D-manno-octulosonic acid transferase [Bdellovibrionota bacterium]|jgi:3-deoxy-D-manno-octulosonic-acid transferase
MKNTSRNIALTLYETLGVLLPPLAALGFLCHPRGRRRLSERFGCWSLQSDEVLWFHGASVGEVLGLLPIIAACKEAFPNLKTLLTVTSPTGLDIATGKTDYQRLLPFDNVLWIRQALKGIKIKAFVFGETEIWPALFRYLAHKDVPLLLVNGRLSESSERFWRKPFFREVLRQCLSRLTKLFVINEKYRERFIACGASAEIVLVNGNAKYDTTPSVPDRESAKELKRSFFVADKPVLVLGSLRPKEEEVWFPALKSFSGIEDLSIVVAPRHQEKMNYFASKLSEYGIEFERRSELKEEGQPCNSSVYLLDTLGELEKVYSFADLAFIGGTLVAGIGGHNPLEAAAYGVPIVLGRHCENIDNVAEDLDKGGGLFWLHNKEEATQLLKKLSDPSLKTMGKAAQSVWKQHRGACLRIVQELQTLIAGRK